MLLPVYGSRSSSSFAMVALKEIGPSKQRLPHWVVDTISHAYEASGRPLPSGLRCHSTRSISTSWAALRGVPLETICTAASWASSGTFSRFYRVNVATPHPLGVVLLPSSAASSSEQGLGFFMTWLV